MLLRAAGGRKLGNLPAPARLFGSPFTLHPQPHVSGTMHTSTRLSLALGALALAHPVKAQYCTSIAQSVIERFTLRPLVSASSPPLWHTLVAQCLSVVN